MVEHFCVKFGDPSCSDFWDIVREKKADWRTHAAENSSPATTVSEGNDEQLCSTAPYDLCWPLTDLELTQAEWPDDGPNSLNSLELATSFSELRMFRQQRMQHSKV